MKNIKERVAAFFYSFRQASKMLFFKNKEFAANLDPFYLCGISYFFVNLRNREKIRKTLIYVIPLIIYSIFQIIMLKHINVMRLVVNCSKIIICIYCLLYMKENYKKFSIYKIVKYSTLILFIVTLVALILNQNDTLWRFHDYVNKYDTTRLQGLFLEPSELGFHVMILVIFLFGYFLSSKNKEKRKTIFILILLNCVTLSLCRPFGAIIVGVIAIMAMLLYDFFANFSRKKLLIYTIILLMLLISFFIGYVLENGVVLRVIDTLAGTDSSNNYRIGISFKVLKQSFIDYNGMGLGFGNLNTAFFRLKYRKIGLVKVVANSFQYFIIEGGIFAIIFLIVLWKKIFKGVKKNPSYAKVGLIVFLFLYQIFGGHFTSALVWLLYGLCISDYREVNEL